MELEEVLALQLMETEEAAVDRHAGTTTCTTTSGSTVCTA